MGLFNQLVKTAARIGTLPVSAVIDIITLGGLLNDSESATVEHIEKFIEDIDDLPDSVDEE